MILPSLGSASLGEFLGLVEMKLYVKCNVPRGLDVVFLWSDMKDNKLSSLEEIQASIVN